MSTKFDDIELIRKFVQGDQNFLANQNLRLEPAFNSAQLLAKKGGLIATAKLAGQIRSVLVRQSSVYQAQINQILTEHQYLPTKIGDRGVIHYEHCPIPAGYTANYTEVRHLWRAWRTQDIRKPHLKYLIQSQQTWLTVEKIEHGQESFFIHVPGEEKMLYARDCLVWLSPVAAAAPAAP